MHPSHPGLWWDFAFTDSNEMSSLAQSIILIQIGRNGSGGRLLYRCSFAATISMMVLKRAVSAKGTLCGNSTFYPCHDSQPKVLFPRTQWERTFNRGWRLWKRSSSSRFCILLHSLVPHNRKPQKLWTAHREIGRSCALKLTWGYRIERLNRGVQIRALGNCNSKKL